MKAISKAELIERIQEQLPDDAMIIGNSTMAGEFFELFDPEDSQGNPFFAIPDEEIADMLEETDMPEGTTHILEIC